MKYVDVNLTKPVLDLYAENCETTKMKFIWHVNHFIQLSSRFLCLYADYLSEQIPK